MRLKSGVCLVDGLEAGGVYDMNNGYFHRVNKDALTLLTEMAIGDVDLAYDSELNEFLMWCREQDLVDDQPWSPHDIHDIRNYLVDDRKTEDIILEITSHCNQKCLHCFVGDELNQGMMAFPQVIRIIDDAFAHDIKKITLSGGEPTLHPRFSDILQYLLAGDAEVTILTNGQRLKPGHIDAFRHPRVLVKVPLLGWGASHDMMTQRRGSFERTIENIRRMVAMGIRVKLTSTVTKVNLNDMDHLDALARELNIPLEKSPIYPAGYARDNWDQLFPENYNDILERSGRVEVEAHSTANLLQIGEAVPQPEDKATVFRCADCGTQMHAIKSDGKVIPCLLLRERLFQFGDATQESLDAVYSSDNEQRHRVKELFSYDKLETCNACEARYACRGGGCRAVSYLFKGSMDIKNPLYDECFYDLPQSPYPESLR